MNSTKSSYYFIIILSLLPLSASGSVDNVHKQVSNENVSPIKAEASEAPSHQLKTLHIQRQSMKSSLFQLVPSVTVLDDQKIVKKSASSLGDAIAGEPGVASTGFGPTAGRPVIRGLQGDRIRILQNGIGFLDASGSSEDHAVPLDPFAMDKVEIVRGPVTLLYGSSAVGGVVNILNSRIHSEYNEGLAIDALTQFQSVNESNVAAVKMDYGFADQWMFHVDTSKRTSKNTHVPGFTRSQELRKQQPLAPSDNEQKYEVMNSNNEIGTIASGVSYIGENGHVGLSAGTYASVYGTVAEPNVQIKMRQNRYDLDAELFTEGFFQSYNLKSALTTYHHEEVENDKVGTRFSNFGNETRVEAHHRRLKNIEGLIGIQGQSFTFKAQGNEMFLPPTDNLHLAPFIFEEWKKDKLALNASFRTEFNQTTADKTYNTASQTFDGSPYKAKFQTNSLALGSRYDFTKNFSTAVQLSYNERAPSFQELFAHGEHLATSTYEIGNPNLKKEKSYNLEISALGHSENFQWNANFFGQFYDNFIALAPNGSQSAGLPEFEYLSQGARIYGAEFEGHRYLGQTNNLSYDFVTKADYLVGENTTAKRFLPRMTPPRVTLGIEAKDQRWTHDFEVQHVFRQSKLAENEKPTASFFMTNLGTNYRIALFKSQLSFFMRINNLFDIEARNAVSLLKDLAPLPGRNFFCGIRGTF